LAHVDEKHVADRVEGEFAQLELLLLRLAEQIDRAAFRDVLHLAVFAVEPGVVWACQRTASDRRGLDQRIAVQADIFKSTDLTVEVLNDDRDAANFAREEGIVFRQKSFQPGKQPGLAEDLALLALEDLLRKVILRVHPRTHGRPPYWSFWKM